LKNKNKNNIYILENHVCPKKCCKIMNIYHTKNQWVTHANEPTWSFVNMFIKCKGFNQMIEWIMCKLTLKGWGVFKIKILLEAKFKGEPKFWGWLTC